MRERFQNARYRDSDVLALYIKYRKTGIGPFIDEVGDFIAHPNRNKGKTLTSTTYAYSQLAFFQTYQGTNKTDLNFFGTCPWWLKSWFLGKLESEVPSILKQISGIKKSKLRSTVKGWFHGDDNFPRQLSCDNPKLFYDLVQRFSRTIRVDQVFTLDAARREIYEIFKHENIDRSEINYFLLATATILSGNSIEIVPGFRASIYLAVQHPRTMKLDIPVPDGAKFHYGVILPDGILKIMVSTENTIDDGLVGIALDFLDLEVDTEPYFCRSLICEIENDRQYLKLDRPLSFERDAEYVVHPG